MDSEAQCARPHFDINCGLILSFDLCTLQPTSEHDKAKRCAEHNVIARKAVGRRGSGSVSGSGAAVNLNAK